MPTSIVPTVKEERALKGEHQRKMVAGASACEGDRTVQTHGGGDLRQSHPFIVLTELGFGLFQEGLQG